MGRLILFQITMLAFIKVNAQNLLLNPDFESVVPHKKNDIRVYHDTFYVKKWFSPTDGTVDVFRDKKICSPDSTFSLEGILDFCVDVQSGNYCIGFIPLQFMGTMEHITGILKIPLISGHKYKISFYMKFHGDQTPYIPNGIGYKCSTDSILFKSKTLLKNKPAPFYKDLFKDEKIYADYSINEYVIDTVWRKFESIYTAVGGERFITFGKFAYKNDKKIIKQLNWLVKFPTADKIEKFLKRKNSSLICKNINQNKLNLLNKDFYCYYFFDNFSVEEIISP
jgi:hypothetical protein